MVCLGLGSVVVDNRRLSTMERRMRVFCIVDAARRVDGYVGNYVGNAACRQSVILQPKISTVIRRPCTLAGPTSEHDRDLFHVERTRPQLLDRSVELEW